MKPQILTFLFARRSCRALSCALIASSAIVMLGHISPARAANLTITPTFDSSITSDPNAAAIEAAINSALQTYHTTYVNSATVNIYFQEMSGGLGESSKNLYFVPYNANSGFSFRPALVAQQTSSGQADQATALANLPNTTNNPVTGVANIAMSTANIKALGGPTLTGVQAADSNFYDGIIGLDTHLTNPGSPGSPLTYNLVPVIQHEVDEVLGLGSSLSQSFQTTGPQPEDLYRFASAGVRSYTTSSSAHAFFSINGGATLLAQFDNQNDGGDWGDWQSNPLPNGQQPRVQDAFATPGANPLLSVELTALDVLGYSQVRLVPEPGTLVLLGLGAIGLFLTARRRKAA